MTPQCAICLGHLKDSVCTPCGHVFCSECLRTVIARGGTQATNGYQASCPCCRKVFPIALPDTRYLPEQFRPFVMDPIRSVYITMDDQDIIQQNESLERENEELKAQIRELEGEEAEAEEAEEADMQFTPPSPSNMVMYVTNTGNATGAFFRPAIRVSPPYPPAYRVRSAHSYTPVVPNRPSLGQTVLGTPTSTRQLPSAPPAGLGGFSTRATDHNTSTSAFTNPFARPTAAQTSAPSTLGPPGPVQRPETQWIVPPNHVPNQSQAAPAADNFLNVTRTITFSRRESRHFVAPPAPDPGSPSPAYTTVDVPASSSASGAENRRPSQSS